MSVRERIFIKAYLANNGNGTAAAKEAGFQGDCRKRAQDILGRTHVWRVIERSVRARLSHLDVKADNVLRECVRIALADPRRFFHLDGSLLPVQEWPEELAAAVSGFEMNSKTGQISKIRLSSKVAAVQLLGQYLSLWEGKTNSEDRLDEIVQALRTIPADEQKEAVQ